MRHQGTEAPADLDWMNWNRTLPQEIVTQSGKHLRTLRDARSYMLAIKSGRERREYWQSAAGLLMEAAKGGSLEAIRNQLVLALLMDGTLDLKRTPV